MRRHASNLIRVLAIDPFSKGFGYVVMEGEHRLIDWGAVEVSTHNRNSECLQRVGKLLRQYPLDLVLVEDCDHAESRRHIRVRTLIREIGWVAQERGVRTRVVPRACVRQAFAKSRARTIAQIAVILAVRLPGLAPRLPPLRRFWMSEDPRIRIFTAASLVVTHFQYKSKQRRSS